GAWPRGPGPPEGAAPAGAGGGAMIPAELHARVEAWIREDPDPGDRAELRALLAARDMGGEPGAAALAELTDRFAGRLQFGTAGPRGPGGAGPHPVDTARARGRAPGP